MAAAQFLIPWSSPSLDTAGLAVRRTKLVTIPPLPTYAAILDAPLFAPDRRPGETQVGPSAGAVPLAGYAALGAATSRTGATAVVSAPGGKVETLKIGDDMDGWRLVALSRTRLTFESKGGRQDLIVGAPAETAAIPPSSDTADQ